MRNATTYEITVVWFGSAQVGWRVRRTFARGWRGAVGRGAHARGREAREGKREERARHQRYAHEREGDLGEANHIHEHNAEIKDVPRAKKVHPRPSVLCNQLDHHLRRCEGVGGEVEVRVRIRSGLGSELVGRERVPTLVHDRSTARGKARAKAYRR